MNSMTLMKKFKLKIGNFIAEVTIKDEWNGFIELDTGTNRGKIIVRRKGWNNGKEWARESNAFMEQELDIIFADERFGISEHEIVFNGVRVEGAPA